MLTSLRILALAALSGALSLPALAQVVAPPTFHTAAGRREAPLQVTIRCATPGAEIHVTMDGAEPRQSDTEIDSGEIVIVDHPLTLKAKAWLPDGSASITQSAVFQPLPATGNLASFDDQSVPSFLAAGQTATISISLRNIGTLPWTPQAYSLVPRKPKDAQTWGVAAVRLAKPVNTWEVATFDFEVTAPAQPGTYSFQWRLQPADAAAFAEATPLKRINVVTPEEYEQLVAKFAGGGADAGTPGVALEKPAAAPKASREPGNRTRPLPRGVQLPKGMPPGSDLARLFAELNYSPRSFRYLRTIGFPWSDAEFQLIVERNKGVFAATRIIRRDESGKRVIPGWPGVKLAKR